MAALGVLMGLASCCCLQVPTGSIPGGSRVEEFTAVWQKFEETYPEFPPKLMNWQLAYGRYLPAAEQAESADSLMLGVVLPMLAELEDWHLWLMTPDNEMIYTWEPPVASNFDIQLLLDTYLNPNGFTGWNGGVGYCPPDQLPYLSINTWIADLNLDRIDDFIEQAQDCPAIILDVRMNPGGNNILCQEAAGRFAGETVLGWLARFRIGPDYDDCEYYEVYTEPMGTAQYTGTVILLMGEYCASSTEDFICSMMNLSNVVMVGDTTLGAACCPAWEALPNHWQFTYAEWSTRLADNQPLEWLGVAPDIPVEATEEHFAQGYDPVMDYSLQMLKEMSGSR